MPQYDLPETELAKYRTAVEAPADLERFWDRTLKSARERSWDPKVERVEAGLRLIEVYDVTFSGFDGEPIKAWYRRPAGSDTPLPTIVCYQGYTGGRGLPHQVGPWPLAGYATLEVDSRGQGAGGGYVGDTPDIGTHGPSVMGMMTRGLLDPDEYYYRRLYTDAVLAVDSAKALPGVDPTRIAVAGASQGGGLALAVASLRDDVAAVMSDVPFLSDFPRGMGIAASGPYLEVNAYLATYREQIAEAFRTLSYFDVSVLVQAAQAPALFSVALMDTVCPPSTVYAAYNAYAGPKEMRTYPYNDHEGGQFHQEAAQLLWAQSTLGINTR